MGNHFLLEFDHAALKLLLQFNNSKGQIASWQYKLQKSNIEREYSIKMLILFLGHVYYSVSIGRRWKKKRKP